MSRKLIQGMDYEIRCVDLKTTGVEGVVVSGPDCPTIVINSRLSEKKQHEALEHELQHLKNDDLYSDESVDVIERRMK